MPTHPRPWHCGSLYGPGPRQPLDRNARARFRFLLGAHARARRLSAKAEWIGLALLKRLGEDGRLDPSHITLAADTATGERTVRRALNRMQGLGLLRWQRRLVRAGWRALQTSNAYALCAESAAVLPADPPAATLAVKPSIVLNKKQVDPTLAVIAARRVMEIFASRRPRTARLTGK